jgi:hypothetical protein
MSIVHIHAPRPTEKDTAFIVCPDCKKESLFLAFFTEWYGWQSTCMRCGREFSEGEWLTLPFYRHARRDNRRTARRIETDPESKNFGGLK